MANYQKPKSFGGMNKSLSYFDPFASTTPENVTINNKEKRSLPMLLDNYSVGFEASETRSDEPTYRDLDPFHPPQINAATTPTTTTTSSKNVVSPKKTKSNHNNHKSKSLSRLWTSVSPIKPMTRKTFLNSGLHNNQGNNAPPPTSTTTCPTTPEDGSVHNVYNDINNNMSSYHTPVTMISRDAFNPTYLQQKNRITDDKQIRFVQPTSTKKMDIEELSHLFIPTLNHHHDVVVNVKPQQITSFLVTGQEAVIRSSEQDATSWQLDIPSYQDCKSSIHLCHFLNHYNNRSVVDDIPINLHTLVGYTKQQLKDFIAGSSSSSGIHNPFGSVKLEQLDVHSIPTVELLVEHGHDFLSVAGYLQISTAGSSSSSSSNNNGNHSKNTGTTQPYREILVVERQRQFLCVINGTIAEQQGKESIYKTNPPPCKVLPYISNDEKNNSVTLFVDPYTAFASMQHSIFALLDKLTEQNPFYDVAFTGHGYGATLATIASFVYANTRPSIRVCTIVSNSCYKAGMTDFRFGVHSSPNLKVIRLELGSVRSKPSTVGRNVGHILRLHHSQPQATNHSSNTDSTNKTIGTVASSRRKTNTDFIMSAYKFGNVLPTRNKIMTSNLLKTKKSKENKTNDYVNALDSIVHWTQQYSCVQGVGVLGRDKETREVA